MERDSAYLRMDAATRRNLEISETILGDAAPTLLSLLDTCSTNMGSRLLRHWLHHPLRDRALIQNRLDGVSWLMGEAGSGPYLSVRACLKRVGDIERITARIALKSARPRDLSGLRDSLKRLPQALALIAEITERQQRTPLTHPLPCWRKKWSPDERLSRFWKKRCGKSRRLCCAKAA